MVCCPDSICKYTDFYMKWIDENIPYEYTEPEDINNTYNILSLADVYYGNRNKQ